MGIFMCGAACPHPGTPTPHMAKLPETVEVAAAVSGSFDFVVVRVANDNSLRMRKFGGVRCASETLAPT
jgi:hypothetical protein